MKRVLLDTNLLVLAFISEKLYSKLYYRETIMAPIGRRIFYDSSCVIVVPNFILEVEVPRMVSRFIVTRGITEEGKLSILINLKEKDLHKTVDDSCELEKCMKIDVWNRKYLRRAAGLYNRLRALNVNKKLGKKGKLTGKHQDIILLACAELENAIIVSADKDLWIFVKYGKLNIPIYYLEIDENRKTCKIRTINISEKTCVDEVLDSCTQCTRDQL